MPLFKNVVSDLKARYKRFRNVIAAGYYRPDKREAEIASDIDDEDDQNVKHNRGMTIALGIGALAWMVVTDVILNAFENLSITGVTAFGISVGVASLLTTIGVYRHCKKAGRDEITELNMAGQRVKGSRYDLYKLHKAQKKIWSLAGAFNEAVCPALIEKEIQRIIDKTAETRQRVTVLDCGQATRHKHDYDLIRPKFAFRDALETQKASPSNDDAAAVKTDTATDASGQNAHPHSQKHPPSGGRLSQHCS